MQSRQYDETNRLSKIRNLVTTVKPIVFHDVRNDSHSPRTGGGRKNLSAIRLRMLTALAPPPPPDERRTSLTTAFHLSVTSWRMSKRVAWENVSDRSNTALSRSWVGGGDGFRPGLQKKQGYNTHGAENEKKQTKKLQKYG